MAQDKMTILLVDDDPHVLDMLEDIFTDEYITIKASSGNEAIERIKTDHSISTVVLDIKMAEMDGIKTAQEIRDINSDLPIIFHTGYPGEYQEEQIEENEKPFDYIVKGSTVIPLIRSVKNAVESYSLKLFRKSVDTQWNKNTGMIGKSIEMQKVFQLIKKIAPTDNKVMILGETGTGKELVARAVYNISQRKDERFGILNCNHKSADLIESELFGHTKGAFTGAIGNRIGLFEYADGGTVFLDEIGDLDITTQAKLLRVIETGEMQTIGSPKIKKVDVRILCATHRYLEEMVEQEIFRQDLYYRLKGIVITLPPLKERREDIPLLIEKFNDDFSQKLGATPKLFDQSAINSLIDYSWPGNVRQLLDTVESIITLTDSDIIFADDVCNYLNDNKNSNQYMNMSLTGRLREFEKTEIIKTLTKTGNNVSKAARILKIDPANLRRKIKLHNINISK